MVYIPDSGLLGFCDECDDAAHFVYHRTSPTALGRRTAFAVMDMLDAWGIHEMRLRFKRLNIIPGRYNEQPMPSDMQIATLKPWTNLKVADRSPYDWYCLLAKTEGDAKKILESGYIVDALQFIARSAECHWAYIINLETEKLEVYEGKQTKPHTAGRYCQAVADYRPEECIPCALTHEIPFADLAVTDWDVVEGGW